MPAALFTSGVGREGKRTMIKRSKGFWITAGIGGCAVLLACAATMVLGVSVVSQLRGNVALPALGAASSGSATNRIVVVGNDRNIYLADPSRRAPVPLTTDADKGETREYDFPTWAPDSEHLAFIGYSSKG